MRSVHWRGVAQLADVSIALRTVVLVDRKKYRRAVSRLTAMAREEAEGLHPA